MIGRLTSMNPRLLRAVTLRLGMLFILSSALIGFLDVPLRGAAAPYGIVSFELAGSPTRALAILMQWRNTDALGHAKLIMVADYVYMLIYGGFFMMLSLWLGAARDETVWSVRAAWASVLAVGFDLLETAVLAFEVWRFASPAPYPQLAAAFAGMKFALLVVPIGYAIASAFAWMRAR